MDDGVDGLIGSGRSRWACDCHPLDGGEVPEAGRLGTCDLPDSVRTPLCSGYLWYAVDSSST